MVKLLKLLRRVIIHKFWVAYYCFQLGLYWQGITHDFSKFSLTEIKGALKYWNDSKSSLAYEKELNGYSATFLHHRGRNPHHYEYWIHSLDEGGVPAEMPRKYVLELICDYLAACRTYGGDPRKEIDWWLKVSPKMKMHPKTKEYITCVFEHYRLNFKGGDPGFPQRNTLIWSVASADFLKLGINYSKYYNNHQKFSCK